MTRVTNLVKRKRTYISEDAPVNARSQGEASSTSKRTKQSHSVAGSASRKPASSISRNSRGDSRFANSSKDRAVASEKRRLQRIDDRNSDKTCFACRESGHTARDCPNTVSVEAGKSTVGICYRCGSDRHTLSRCRKPENKANPLPFAQCFVCSQKGHLAGSCPSNMNGLYPNGGGCKLCDQNDHLAKDCPTRRPPGPTAAPILGIVVHDAPDAGADEDDFHALKRRTNAVIREEAAQQRIEKLERKPAAHREPAVHLSRPSMTEPFVNDVDPLGPIPGNGTKSSGTEAGTHPDRQAMIAGGPRRVGKAPPMARSSSTAPQARLPGPIHTQEDRTTVQAGSAAPAFIPRGTAALPMRKTKVVSF